MRRWPVSLCVASLALPVTVIACSSSDASSPAVAASSSAIKHVVIVVQENHSFDAYFGRYCTAPTGSSPTCTDGAACCEAAPAAEPGQQLAPIALDDAANADYDPSHLQVCEVEEMNGGKMDTYTSTTTPLCGDPRNFAIAEAATVQRYWDMARAGALADRYFQPVAGQSSSNDQYLARARFVFLDNTVTPDALGAACGLQQQTLSYSEKTIGDLLNDAKVPWAFYAEGYQAMVDAQAKSKTACPPAPADCAAKQRAYPCVYAPDDNPFTYYPSVKDDPRYAKDYAQLKKDLDAGALPSVSFVKALGYKSEHPGSGDTVSAGVDFVSNLVATVEASSAASDTLVLVTYDESGGYFDHIAPPATSAVDQQPYGPRIPTLALGRFARKNFVSHVEMEHSSIVKFIEWNWLGATTGQLGARDAVVNNLGSLLDPAATVTPVPEQ
jgi:phospholipase C